MTTPYSPPRKLERSRTDRVLGGVCGGVAKYLNMDPTLVRVLSVALGVFFGVTIVVYLVLLFVLPEETLISDPPQVRPADPESDRVWGTEGAPWEQQRRPE